MSTHQRSGLPNYGCVAGNAIKGGHERNAYGVCALCGDGHVAATLPAAPAPTGIPAFNPNAKCSPLLTQCPRCNNPHHECDQNLGVSMPAPAPTDCEHVPYNTKGGPHDDDVIRCVKCGKYLPVAALEQAGELPPLPNWTALSITMPNQFKTIECMWEGPANTRKCPLFTEQQMRDYARAVLAARQAPAGAAKERSLRAYIRPDLSAVDFGLSGDEAVKAEHYLNAVIARQAPDSRDAANGRE